MALTNDEEHILNIIGTVAVEGDPQVTESQCDFVFEDTQILGNPITEEGDGKLDILTGEPEGCLRMLQESQPGCSKWADTPVKDGENGDVTPKKNKKRKCTPQD